MARALPTLRAAQQAVERHGALLVYPMANREQPRALWHVLHPGVTMRWAWDENADRRVVHLWQLREELAQSRSVVYSKWFQGRAVFFSRPLFTAMLATVRAMAESPLSRESRELLSLLRDDSPRSSKALRKEAGLTGKPSEALFTRALRELWERLSIVGTGEVDDGAFPSLAVGATQLIFEELWEEAGQGVRAEQARLLEQVLPDRSAFGKHWRRTLQRIRQSVVELASR